MSNKVTTEKQEPAYEIKWRGNAYARIIGGRIDLFITSYSRRTFADSISDDPAGFVEFAQAIESCLKGE